MDNTEESFVILYHNDDDDDDDNSNNNNNKLRSKIQKQSKIGLQPVAFLQ
jgi:hypothetical protein